MSEDANKEPAAVMWPNGGEPAITARLEEVVPKTTLDHHTDFAGDLLNRSCNFSQPLYQSFDDQLFCASVEFPAHLLVALDHRVPVAHVNTQSCQQHQKPLGIFAWLDGMRRWRQPKCLPVRAQQPLIRCSSTIEQIQPVVRTVNEVFQRDLKVDNREAPADPVLPYARPVWQQDGQKGGNGGRPSARRRDGIPRHNAALNSELFAAKNPLHPNHSLTPLPSGPHSATSQTMTAQPITLANVTPPRDLRTHLPKEADHG